MRSVTNAANARVFSAGGRCFTWADVIEAAVARGEWAALQRHALGLVARENTGELPDDAQVRAAANEFRYRHNLLSADELQEWLARFDVSFEEWMAEMRRSLLEPADQLFAASPEAVERASWVHAVCSGKLAAYALTLAEEVAVHLSGQAQTVAADELVGLPQERERFCAALLADPALAAEISNNELGWTRVNLRSLSHRDEGVVREAALCVRLDGRELADVAADAGAELRETCVLLDDVEPALRTRLLAARPGEIIGPLAAGTDHLLVHVVARVRPSLDDSEVRQRAGEAIIARALAGEINRHVNWHENL